ncbi:MAG: ATP-binding protein [Patescibacteria group bacterium]
MYYRRLIEEKIEKSLFKGKIIVIYGARQVGKTTLAQKILKDHPQLDSKYINCDQLDYQTLLSASNNSDQLKLILGGKQLIVFDEAQRIKNIGLKLKMMVDNFPNQQIIATGSSSFDLANEVVEPLTGRAIEFWLYPLSFPELQFDNQLEANRKLESLLVFGSYPQVFTCDSTDDKRTFVNTIAANYLYKDVLKFNNLKSADAVRKLLEALALQISSEVSYTEIASLIGISKETVASYVELLEKVFVVFRLPPFSRNLRKEIGKMRKIYFYDLGIRNALINNFNPLSLRDDIGKLWENFVISEKMKTNNFIGETNKFYFWRTYDKQEIDLIEEKEGKLFGYEIKWQKQTKKAPKSWRQTYSNATWQMVDKDNYFKFLKT